MFAYGFWKLVGAAFGSPSGAILFGIFALLFAGVVALMVCSLIIPSVGTLRAKEKTPVVRIGSFVGSVAATAVVAAFLAWTSLTVASGEGYRVTLTQELDERGISTKDTVVSFAFTNDSVISEFAGYRTDGEAALEKRDYAVILEDDVFKLYETTAEGLTLVK